MTWDLFAWTLVAVMLQKVVQFLVLLGATQTLYRTLEPPVGAYHM